MADRLEKLKELEKHLYANMQDCDPRSLAALARQYRETINEIEEIEGADTTNDTITTILEQRQSAGKSGAVRKSRTKVQLK